MDRESDHEEMESKEQGENGAESEEDSDMDTHAAFLRKIQNELSQRRRDDSTAEVDEIRRLYEANNNNSTTANNNSSSSSSSNNNGHGPHAPIAHRPPSCSAAVNATSASPFSTFSPHLANDRLFQYSINNYLQSNPTFQQQYQSAAGLNSIASLQSSLMQPGTSFQSLPSSRIPSPSSHHQQQPFPRRDNNSPPQSYNRSPPNFQSPPPAHIKRSASVSSRQSREESTSPIHQNSWSFEEQFKQLYDIDRDDPKRKEFLDDLFSFMQKHETPVTRLPIMAKSVLDLYELYKLVVQRGGLVDVINKKLWQEVIKGLNLPSSITSAAFTLRTQYMKFLYRYECHKLGLSTPAELTTAIEGNKREGRRTSYYGDIGQMQSPNSNGTVSNNGHQSSNSLHHSQSRMSPVSLVTTSTAGNSINNRLQINGHSNQFGSHAGNASSIPSAHGISPLVLQGAPVPVSPEARILEYIKLMNTRMIGNTTINGTGSSPELPEASNISGLDAQLALWNFYNGVVKQPLQQSPVLPFQPARPQSQNSTNEAPLDLGKSSRKREGAGMEIPAVKKQLLENDVPDEDEQNENEVTDSESEDEVKFQVSVKNSSQEVSEDTKLSPMTVKIKINGAKYKGVLHKYA